MLYQLSHPVTPIYMAMINVHIKNLCRSTVLDMLESREVIEQIIDWKAKQLSCSQVDNGALVEEVDSTFGHEAKAINH